MCDGVKVYLSCDSGEGVFREGASDENFAKFIY